ncbi:hypothetical protein DFJ63DRAFT_186487 [Scheffersomyces coipomensis]|uniref:uncharacterized protein n=1 Tax=Scheffersomyces coipomensis TaxID=1788519 RepID=UPI00315D6695
MTLSDTDSDPIGSTDDDDDQFNVINLITGNKPDHNNNNHNNNSVTGSINSIAGDGEIRSSPSKIKYLDADDLKRQKISPASFFSFNANDRHGEAVNGLKRKSSSVNQSESPVSSAGSATASPARATRATRRTQVNYNESDSDDVHEDDDTYRDSFNDSEIITTTTNTRRTTRTSKSNQSDEDEFNVQLPSIFETDGKRNEVISNNDKLIKQDLIREETRLKKNYQRLIIKKDQILKELNDNGSNGLKVYTLPKDEHLIEKVLKNNFKQSNARHFYFLDNCLIPTPSKYLEYDELPFKINDFFFYNITDDVDVSQYLFNYKSIVNYCLLHVHDLDKLQRVNLLGIAMWKYMERCKSSIDKEEVEAQLRAIGCNIGLVKGRVGSRVDTLSVKLNQFNNNLELSLVRITIIYNFAIYALQRDDPDDLDLVKYMIKVLFLIISDFNLNKRCYPGLVQLVQRVMPEFYDFNEDHLNEKKLDLAKFCYHALKDTLQTKIINQEESSSSNKRYDYELQFNVLKLFHNAFIKYDDIDFQKFITNLSLSFLFDKSYNNYKKKTKNVGLTPNVAVLETIFNKMLAIDMIKGLENNDIDIINQVYHIHYKILLINLIMLRSYVIDPEMKIKKDAKLTESQFEQIRSQNVTRLKSLLSLIDKLKTKMYDSIRQIGFINSNNNPNKEQDEGESDDSDDDKDTTRSHTINTEELVKYVTDSFHTLNYIYNKFDNDLYPINDDIFYNTG